VANATVDSASSAAVAAESWYIAPMPPHGFLTAGVAAVASLEAGMVVTLLDETDVVVTEGLHGVWNQRSKDASGAFWERGTDAAAVPPVPFAVGAGTLAVAAIDYPVLWSSMAFRTDYELAVVVAAMHVDADVGRKVKS
jgi:hypothetical protein